MKNVAKNFIHKVIPDAENNEMVHRFFLAPDTLTRFLYARDFNLAKAFDMYSKSMVRYKQFNNDSNGIWIINLSL